MHTEYEVRILEINRDEIIKKLEEHGAKLEFDALQRRYVYDFKPAQPQKWIRLRTNGKKTTLTIKNIEASKIDGTKELEIEVSDFEATNQILEKLGYKPKGYQENKRRQYILNNVEIDIDSWPMIPDYVEIEGKDTESVLKMINLLGYKENDTTPKGVEEIYESYGYDLESIYELKLEEERK